MMMRPLGLLVLLVATLAAANYTSFVDEDNDEVGLKDFKGDICLSLSFTVNLINYNINGSNNKIPFPLSDSSVLLSGNCAREQKSDAQFTASIRHENRNRQLNFYFGTKNVVVKHSDELRWQLKKVIYVESYDDKTATFESDNSSIVMSAPLNQKYVCKDRLNITLHGDGYSDVIVEFSPEIDVQPYGPKTNFFLCERTRRRTLRESFDNRATVFSGFVLGLASIAALVGHSVRRHFIPERKEQYPTFTALFLINMLVACFICIVGHSVRRHFIPERKEQYENLGLYPTFTALFLINMLVACFICIVGHSVRRHFIPERKEQYENLGLYPTFTALFLINMLVACFICIVGHSVRRHFIPERKEQYENLGLYPTFTALFLINMLVACFICIVGHSVRRHFIPERKEQYENLGLYPTFTALFLINMLVACFICIVGHSVRRHFIPERKEQYENLGLYPTFTALFLINMLVACFICIVGHSVRRHFIPERKEQYENLGL